MQAAMTLRSLTAGLLVVFPATDCCGGNSHGLAIGQTPNTKLDYWYIY